MTISEVLDRFNVLTGMNGMIIWKGYVTLTLTLFPLLLHGLTEGVQDDPVSGQVVVTFAVETLGSRSPLFWT